MNLNKTHPGIIFGAACALLLVLLALTAALGIPSPFGNTLSPVGPDSFMHLIRIEAWWDAGIWYGQVSERSNSPFGEVLHWTRPLDLLVLAVTLVFNIAVTFSDALFMGGFIIGPLLGMVLLGILAWGNAGRQGEAGSVVLLAVLAISVPELRGYFIPMRVDHHSLLLVAFVAMLMALVRMADNETDDKKGRPDNRPRLAWISGAAAGLALWTSVEALVSVLIGAGALGLLWLVLGGRWLGLIGRFLWGLVGVLAVGLLVERPLGDFLNMVTYDQPSIVHFSALGVAALTWSLLAWLRPHLAAGLKGRWMVGLAGLAIPLAVQAILFPEFFQSPFGAAMDPRLDVIWLAQVSELQTLFKLEARTLAKAFVHIGPGAIAMIWTIWALRRGDAAMRKRAMVLGVALGITIPLAIYQVRWGSYLGAVSILPWWWAMVDAWRNAGTLRAWGRQIPMRSAAFLGVYTAPFLLGVIAFGFVDTANAKKPPTTCQWETLAPALKALPGPLNIMSFTHQGPEILWRTPHNVVATPYHRNTAGILDSHVFFSTDNTEVANAIAGQRGLDMVIVCRDSVEARNFAIEDDAFIHRLNDGDLPQWLKPEHLQGDEDFLVFRVR